MSATADSPIVAQPAESAEGALVLIAWAMALALIALWAGPMALATIRDGVLVDNDDAMRLVQLRDWMAGAGWYDVTQYRIDPPAGTLMHWPRLVELPLAMLVWLFGWFVEQGVAERLAMVVWPMTMLAALVLILIALSNRLFSPAMLLIAALLIALNPLLQFQLAPGRIDHHGAQMLLSMVLATATLVAVVDRRTGAAVLAGLVASLMLAIGLETVPLIALAGGVFGTMWVMSGKRLRLPVMAFGLALAGGAFVMFLATVPPSRWLEAHADVLSLPWLWLAVAGGLSLAALAGMDTPPRLQHRAGWAAAAGLGIAAVLVAFWPHVLAGPLADIDPLVRRFWAEGVGETKPLPELIAERPADFLPFLAFTLGGWIGLCVIGWREGRRRPEFVVLLGFATVALAMAVGAMRAAPFAALFALFGWLAMIDIACAPLGGGGDRRRKLKAALSGVALVVLALPFGWSMVVGWVRPAAAGTDVAASCGDAADLAPLASQPEGLVLAPLRLGPRILAASAHSVLGAPYHRNNDGNRFAIATLMDDPATAKREMAARGVRYVALCAGDPDLPGMIAAAPGSLAATLSGGTEVPWLAPLPAVGAIRAWRVVD